MASEHSPGRHVFGALIRKMPAAHAVLPEGDFRDWAEIEAWAGRIAHELAQVPAGRR